MESQSKYLKKERQLRDVISGLLYEYTRETGLVISDITVLNFTDITGVFYDYEVKITSVLRETRWTK